MEKFGFYAPTRIVFGKDTEKQAGALCKQYGARKVLVHFGGRSAQSSGLLDRVCRSLEEAGLEYVLLGGVVPNPVLSKVYEGIALGKSEQVDFILAVGGGSVIDSAKAIAYGLANEGDIWDYYENKRKITASLPTAAVLTLAAAGSEMSNSSVITKEESLLKRGLSTDYAYCRFAVLNPELTYTLPVYQTASGCTDIIMHTLERYFVNYSTQTLAVTDMFAAAVVKNVMRSCKVALREPEDYTARAEIMWSGTLSHNNITGDRSFGDWAVHQLEHELSGKFGVAHGAGLAAVWGSWARYVYKKHPARFAKFAMDVFGIPYNCNSVEETALAGIVAMEDFFKQIGMPVSIRELLGRGLTEEEIKELAYKCSFMDTRSIGMLQELQRSDMENIYRLAQE